MLKTADTPFFFVLIWLLWWLLGWGPCGVLANHHAKRLYDVLLRQSGYNKFVRPVYNASDPIDVQLGLRLSQLIDVVSVIPK